MEYIYKAFDNTGKKLEGIVSAGDIVDAKRKIKENGLILIEIRENKYDKYFKKKIRDVYIYRIFNQLSILIKTGISLDTALSICIDSIENRYVQDILEKILMDIKSGKDVYLAFHETGNFSPFVISMIKIGEKTGNLKEAFANIAQYIKFNIEFKNDIKNAMMYPSFLILASLIALLGIFKIIIPRFFSIFAEGVDNIPLISKVIYNISLSINSQNTIFILILFGLLIFMFRNKNFKFIFSKVSNFLIALPLLKKFFIELELSRFCYTMNSMLKSGVEFINALNYSSDIINNENIKKSIKQTIPQIKQGKSISKVFNEIDFLPSIFKGTIKVGEESGRMAEMFFELYQYFDSRFRNSIKKFLNILEPLIITFMGIIIGIIVLSLILTIMSVSNIKI